MVDPLWKAIGEVLDRFIPAVEGDEIATAIAVALRTRGFIAANVYQCRTCGWVDGEHDPNDDRCNPFADTPAAASQQPRGGPAVTGPFLPMVQRCADCGAEWVLSHVCPSRSTVAPATTGPTLTFTLPTFPECRYCHGHHGARYACDELIEAAAAARGSEDA